MRNTTATHLFLAICFSVFIIFLLSIFSNSGSLFLGKALAPISLTDSDSQLAQATLIPHAASCTDSDPTNNLYVKGYVSGFKSNSPFSVYDYCSGATIFEQICSGKAKAEISYVCPGGCANGACSLLGVNMTNATLKIETTKSSYTSSEAIQLR